MGDSPINFRAGKSNRSRTSSGSTRFVLLLYAANLCFLYSRHSLSLSNSVRLNDLLSEDADEYGFNIDYAEVADEENVRKLHDEVSEFFFY